MQVLSRKSNKVEFNDFSGVGWCSWYQYFSDITFEQLSKNIRLLAEIRDREKIDYRLVQLDDGYQEDIGDWLETNSKFPELKEIASEIRKRKFRRVSGLHRFLRLKLRKSSGNIRIGS